jgi:hypothetical protein
MSYTARPLTTNQLQNPITQNGHDFIVGDIIIWEGNPTNAYVLAQANSLADCAGSMMVSFVPNVNQFYATQTGYIVDITGGYTAGIQYYLSPGTAGALTSVMPATAGEVVLPCMVFDTTSSGYFYGGSGTLVESGSLLAWNTVSTNTVMSPNNGYFTTAAVNMTLPTNYSQSDVLRICSETGNGFTILQTQSYHQILDLGLASTAGSGGTTSTTSNGASIELVAVSNNGPWRVVSNKGSFTYA